MKKTNVIIGIVIFAILVTVPFWSAILSPASGAAPEVNSNVIVKHAVPITGR